MKKTNKKVVWDLFGGLNGSLGLAIGYENYDIYTIDVLPKTKDGRENIVANLAIEKKRERELWDLLDKLPAPDYIAASPMCMSFSRGSSMSNGSTGFELNDDKTIKPRENFGEGSGNIITKKDGSTYLRTTPEKSKANGELGIRALEITLKIIDKYKPKHWYIENPATSLMWNYVKYNLNMKDKNYFNLVHYGAYGGVSKKPTIFYSNIDLQLELVDKNYRSKIRQTIQKRKDRSDIPSQLIRDIFKKFNN